MRDVLVVGGGPVGLFLASLLAEAGLDVVVWERRREAAPLSRAIGIHAPAVAALDAVGLAGPVLEEAVLVRRGLASCEGAVLGEVSFARAHPRYPFVATLPQFRTEELLEDRLAELAPGALVRGVTAEGLVQDDASVRVTGTWTEADETSGAEPVEVRARFVVGADGARSVVRDLLGVRATVHEYPDTYVMGDVTDALPEDVARIHLEPGGVVESFPLPGGVRRLVVHSPHPAVVTAGWFADTVRARTGAEIDPAGVTMLSAFGVRRRFASRTVVGRVVLVGDAAHEISPIGGQGMNLGWLDAAALAPVLVRSLATGTPDALGLDRFERGRTTSARRAARQAELNMTLGRPVHGPRLAARNAALVGALRSPVSRVLASVYAMRWS